MEQCDRCDELENEVERALSENEEQRAEIERQREALFAHKAWQLAEDRIGVPLDNRTALCAWAGHLTDVALGYKAEPFEPQPHGFGADGSIIASDEAQCRTLVDAVLETAPATTEPA